MDSAEQTMERVAELVVAAGTTGMTADELGRSAPAVGIAFAAEHGPLRFLTLGVSRGVLVGPDDSGRFYGRASTGPGDHLASVEYIEKTGCSRWVCTCGESSRPSLLEGAAKAGMESHLEGTARRFVPVPAPQYVTDDRYAVYAAVPEVRPDGTHEGHIWLVVGYRHDVAAEGHPETAWAVWRVHWLPGRGRYMAYDGDYDLTLIAALEDMTMRSGTRRSLAD